MAIALEVDPVWIPADVDDVHRSILTTAASCVEAARAAFPGHYLALLGEKVIAHAVTLAEARDQAREVGDGHTRWVLYVDPRDSLRPGDAQACEHVAQSK